MNPTPIAAADAKTMLDRGEPVTFIDARNPTAWGSSTDTLPGAVRVPVDDVDAHLGEIPTGSTAITYCT